MTILFKVFAQLSHHNSTFPLALALAARGHHVVYVAPPEIAGVIAAQGLNVVIQEKDFLEQTGAAEADKPPSYLTRLKLTVEFWSCAGQAARKIENCRAFDALLDSLKPDAVLVDSPYTPFALSLFRRRIRFAVLETTVSLHFTPGIAPPFSTRGPGVTWFSRLINNCLWLGYFARRRLLAEIGADPVFSRRVIRRAALAGGFSMGEVDLSRYLQLGLRRVPEILLSPPEFDFPRERSPNQWYANSSIKIERSEKGHERRFDPLFERVIREKTAGIPIVYCAMGTASRRYAGVRQFFSRLVQAATGESWNLVLATGNIDWRDYCPLPTNVCAFQSVPQIYVLRYADVMINHGGLNSIVEAIMSEVPCLVFPGNARFDQPGNAARVVYHGLGEAGSLRRDSVERIRRMIRVLLNEPRYRAALAQMRSRITERSKVQDVGALVEGLLRRDTI